MPSNPAMVMWYVFKTSDGLTVEEISNKTNISKNLSRKHCNYLKQLGLVFGEKHDGVYRKANRTRYSSSINPDAPFIKIHRIIVSWKATPRAMKVLTQNDDGSSVPEEQIGNFDFYRKRMAPLRDQKIELDLEITPEEMHHLQSMDPDHHNYALASTNPENNDKIGHHYGNRAMPPCESDSV